MRLAFVMGRGGHIPRFVSMQVLLLIVLWENALSWYVHVFRIPFRGNIMCVLWVIYHMLDILGGGDGMTLRILL